MARMNALEFLRARASHGALPDTVLIFGPQAFLREYVLDVALASVPSAGCERVHLQLGPGDSAGVLVHELSASSLFAPARIIVCRVLRARRTRGEPATDEPFDARPKRDSDTLLAKALSARSPGTRLLMLYEHERAPSAIIQVVESHGLAVVCAKPFPSQIEQYAQLFARRLGLNLSASASAYLAERCNGDLAGLHNMLNLAAIEVGPNVKLGVQELSRPFAGGAPELFDLARCVSAGDAGRFLALLERASAVGRDAVEVLAVEVIPTLRRMLVAASMASGGATRAEIGRALGLAAHSLTLESAIGGAARLGLERITTGYREAVRLDTAFKMGLVREREAALGQLMLNLLSPSSKQ